MAEVVRDLMQSLGGCDCLNAANERTLALAQAGACPAVARHLIR
jgi:hypothetical protein